MDLYTLEELKDENGKIDFKDARGCIETWVADLKCSLDNVDQTHHGKSIENKEAVLIGIELFGLFGLGWDLK